MVNVMYGAVGTVAVIALLALGFFLGWKASGLYREKMRQNAKKELTEQEQRAAAEEREAFTQLLNYSPDIAYGVTSYTQTREGSE